MPKPKVVILCGGRGTRLKEETEFRPKPLVNIGGKPIVWHIMKHYAQFGYTDFVLCLGYKGEMIKEYFLNLEWMTNDFTLHVGQGKRTDHTKNPDKWNITFADTGLKTKTGGRIKKIEKYIDTDYFLATYGDGVSTVDIKELVEFHKKAGVSGTITGVHPISKYGALQTNDQGIITSFAEKPMMKEFINGGFFVLNKDIFSYLESNVMLEQEPFEQLTKEGKLAMFAHTGFWHCMDTHKDFLELNKIWEQGAPWNSWS